MVVLNMFLRFWCLFEDMTDREFIVFGWVVTLYFFSVIWSLCLDFRFFSGLDYDFVEYGRANFKLLKRYNNRCYDIGYDIKCICICIIFIIRVICI